MSPWIAGFGTLTPDEGFVPPYDESRIIVLDFGGLEEIIGTEMDRWHANVVGSQLWASGDTETLAWIALVAYWRLLLMDPLLPLVVPQPPAQPPPAPIAPATTTQSKPKRRRRSNRRKRKK